jgi:hypothetical protein
VPLAGKTGEDIKVEDEQQALRKASVKMQTADEAAASSSAGKNAPRIFLLSRSRSKN